MKKQILSVLLALTMLLNLAPTTVWAEEAAASDETTAEQHSDYTIGSDTDPQPVTQPDEWIPEITREEETWEITLLSPQPTRSRAATRAVSSTTAYINTSDFPYTNTSTGQAMAVHWIDDGTGHVMFAWCIEPSKTAVNGDKYGYEGESSAQLMADVLQIGYEWDYWGGYRSGSSLPTDPDGHAAVQIAIWRALGYTAVCSDSSVNAMASSLLDAARDDSGCGGGELAQYRCTSNSSRQRLVTYEPYRTPTIEYGNVKLSKSSADILITGSNSCYSLSGAVYGVYSSRNNALNDTRRLGTLTTNANGVSNTLYDLEADSIYYVKELTAPKGYALDTAVHTIYVSADRTAVLKVSDTPQTDPVGVLLKKVDATTGKGETRS